MNRIFLIFFLFSFKTISCFSYGQTGHEVVGLIAKVYTKKAVVDSVNKYLEGMSWGAAATWMDEVRSNSVYDYLRPMHYVDFEKGTTYVKTEEPNSFNKLEEVINELMHRGNLSKEKIQENIKILFHLVGDMHQPLHNGYSEDRGGNDITVYFIGKVSNLHSVWDTGIIEYKTSFKHEVVELSKKLTLAELKSCQEVDVMSWMNEARSYLPNAYDFKKGNLNEKYADTNSVIIEKLILKAGIRLSAVLNQVFAG